MINLLIEYGADVNIKDKKGLTSLAYAKRQGFGCPAADAALTAAGGVE